MNRKFFNFVTNPKVQKTAGITALVSFGAFIALAAMNTFLHTPTLTAAYVLGIPFALSLAGMIVLGGPILRVMPEANNMGGKFIAGFLNWLVGMMIFGICVKIAYGPVSESIRFQYTGLQITMGIFIGNIMYGNLMKNLIERMFHLNKFAQ